MRIVIIAAVLAMGAFAGLRGIGEIGVASLVKPAPVALLALGVATTRAGPGVRWLTVGLAMSAIADFAIDRHFLVGLAVFLAAHLAYIAAFVREAPRLAPLRAVPFVALVIGAGSVFVPAAGGLGGPVGAYTVVIGLMGWRAAARAGAVPLGTMGLGGALLFMASDTLLATNLFVRPVPYESALVMSTYWAGQLLIALSAPRAPSTAP